MANVPYFLYRAQNIQERGLSFYATLSEWYALSDYLTSVSQMSTILRLIEMCEIFIARSKYMRA